MHSLLVRAEHSICQHCSLYWSSGLFLEESPSVHSFYHEGNGLLHKKLQVHFKAKIRSHTWCNHQYQLRAACSLLCYSHSSRFILQPRKSNTTQTQGSAVHAMQHWRAQPEHGSLTSQCMIVCWVPHFISHTTSHVLWAASSCCCKIGVLFPKQEKHQLQLKYRQFILFSPLPQ